MTCSNFDFVCLAVLTERQMQSDDTCAKCALVSHMVLYIWQRQIYSGYSLNETKSTMSYLQEGEGGGLISTTPLIITHNSS